MQEPRNSMKITGKILKKAKILFLISKLSTDSVETTLWDKYSMSKD